MKFVHLVIPDLLLPQALAGDVYAGLSLPALQKLLGRGRHEILEPVSLEQLLYLSFAKQDPAHPALDDAPIAPISACFDGLGPGCWLRADPVHLNLQRDQLLLAGVRVASAEAAALCASLNMHFAGQGIEFLAPHPQRWYLRLSELPRMRTTPLSQALGGDVRGMLPSGEEAAHWHRLSNEIQMLLHAHPVNEARVARGEPVINSLWFWGGGCDTLLAKPADCGNSRQAAPVVSGEVDTSNCDGGGCDRASGSMRSSGEPAGPPLAGALPQKNFDCVSSDDVLAEMFAEAADVPFSIWQEQWRDALSLTLTRGESGCLSEGRQLLVWTGLRSALQHNDLAAWRTALQDFENGYAQPILQALRSGRIAQLQLDVAGRDGIRSIRLTRRDTWAFWRRTRRLAEYSLV